MVEIRLTANNQTAEPVRVHVQLISMLGEEHTYDLGAASSMTVQYREFQSLEVTIRRISDKAVLFDARWDNDELRALHGNITVDVLP